MVTRCWFGHFFKKQFQSPSLWRSFLSPKMPKQRWKSVFIHQVELSLVATVFPRINFHRMCKPPRCRWDTCDRRSCWYQEPWDPMAVSSKPLPMMGFRSWDPPCLLWPSFIFLNPLHTQPQFINWGLQEQAKQHPGLAALPWAWRSHPRTCRAKHRAKLVLRNVMSKAP